jgi:hypothetical protein
MDPAMGLAGSVVLETITMARTMYIRLNLTAMALTWATTASSVGYLETVELPTSVCQLQH